MKSFYLSKLNIGDELTNESYFLQDVTRRNTKDGRPYLLCNLRDKTGQAGAVFWNVPDYINDWVKPGAAVLVTGRVVNYKDSVQVSITDMNQDHSADLEELLASSTRSRDEMITELRQFISQTDTPWRTLLEQILLDEPFLNKFASAPAARSMHHAYIGGLLEHSLSMTAIAQTLAQHYLYVKKDLLIAGTLLHDIGKTAEYALESGFAYTEDGRLVGHIVRAIVMIETAAAAINFPEDDLRYLIHLIASHHGTQEWGSPTVPKTLEAILLHQIDLLDSRIQGYFDHLKNDNSGHDWTAKSSIMFGTELRRPEGMGVDDQGDTS